jgi:hypothetical protein
MCDWEGCTTGIIGLPNQDQRSVAKTSGFPHPYIYTYTARALPMERILALRGDGITWMGQPSRQGIVLFSVRTEFWRSTRLDGKQPQPLNSRYVRAKYVRGPTPVFRVWHLPWR